MKKNKNIEWEHHSTLDEVQIDTAYFPPKNVSYYPENYTFHSSPKV